jgi:phage FluMu protein Com
MVMICEECNKKMSIVDNFAEGYTTICKCPYCGKLNYVGWF